MITTPTVLVLGAGASAPYGYPLGDGLTARIRDFTTPKGGAVWNALVGEYHQPLVDEFHRALANSDPRSIDDFLESNPQFVDIGKVCIAAALTVFGPTPDSVVPAQLMHWYQYLWHLMHADAATPEQFRGNAVRVVTYNYESSFELYFRACLGAMYPKLARGEGGTTEAFANEVLPVVHLHGSLGPADANVRDKRDRSGYNNLQFYQRAASGIRIVHEDERTDEYATAHTWIGGAKVLCFLGFGYHPTNVRRLKLKQVVTGKAMTFIGGTCLGLGEAERTRALALFEVGFRGDEFPFLDAREFLRQKFIW